MNRLKRITILEFCAIVAIAVVVICSLAVGPPTHAQQQLNAGVPFHCVVTVSTATSLTAVGGNCIAPTSGGSLHLTSIVSSTSDAGIAADSYNTLKYGSGSACGTGTTTVWQAFTPAATQATAGQLFQTPVFIPAGNALCWINSTAGSKAWVIDGFIS